MDDSERLSLFRERIESSLWMIAGHLGLPGFGDSAGMAIRLKLTHDELMLIRSSVQRIGFGVFVIALAVVASVWHHW